MTAPYGISSTVHSGALYDRINTFDDDLPFYKKWTLAGGGEVLELCCGTGRLTIPLAQAGVPIRGLDHTASMLAEAKRKALKMGVQIPFLQGDMRSFSLGRQFNTIFIPFNSLQCLYTTDDLLALFACVSAHLAPGGVLIFDIFNPSIHLMVAREKGFVPVDTFLDESGRRVALSERCSYDPAGQVNRVVWRYERGDQVEEAQLDMRCFYPLEMDALLRLAGYRVVELFGGFDETPFTSSSTKMIFIVTPQ